MLGIMNYGGHTLAVNTSVDLAAKYRSDFKVFDYVTYMNSCSQGAIADSVKESCLASAIWTNNADNFIRAQF